MPERSPSAPRHATLAALLPVLLLWGCPGLRSADDARQDRAAGDSRGRDAAHDQATPDRPRWDRGTSRDLFTVDSHVIKDGSARKDGKIPNPDGGPPGTVTAVLQGDIAAGDSAQIDAVAVDSSGNAFIVGSFTGQLTLGTFLLTSAGGSDIFLARVDASGNVDWATRAGGYKDDHGRAVATNSSRVCLAGDFSNGKLSFGSGTGSCSFNNTTNTADAFVACVDPIKAGTCYWSRDISSSGVDSATDVHVDATNEVYIGGSYGASFTATVGTGTQLVSNAGGLDGFLARYDAKGGLAWINTLTAPSDNTIRSLAVDEMSKQVFVTGSFEAKMSISRTSLDIPTKGTCTDIFLIRFQIPTGAFGLQAIFGGDGCEAGAAVAVQSDGKVLLTGTFSSTLTFGTFTLTSQGSAMDAFVARLDPTGAVQWAKRLGGSDYDDGRGVASDGAGNIYLTGSFKKDLYFDGASLMSAAGQTDIFLLKLDSTAGNKIQALRFGGASWDDGNAVGLWNSGGSAASRAYLAGRFSGSFSLGGAFFVSTSASYAPLLILLNP